MRQSRRGFFATLVGGAAAVVIPPPKPTPQITFKTLGRLWPKKIGDTIFMRKPSRFVAKDGLAYTPESLTMQMNAEYAKDLEFVQGSVWPNSARRTRNGMLLTLDPKRLPA